MSSCHVTVPRNNDAKPSGRTEEDLFMADGKKSGLDAGLLVLRLALGGIFIMHGLKKMWLSGAPGVNGVTDMLAGLGVPYPYPMAIALISTEIGGGLLVVLGLFTRIGALGLAVTMVVAIIKVHWRNGFFLPLSAEGIGPIPMGYEYCLALLSMALCILLTGPGSIKVPVGKGGGH
jgi:putative oxidoreductase